VSVFSELRDSRELVVNLTRREVKGKYKRTALGQLWSLANPIASMLVYTVVFSVIIKVPHEPGDPSRLNVFALWLMCALLPWSFFTNVVTGGMGALVGNENLIKKVYFPRAALVVASTFSALFTWSIEMLVLAAVLLVVGASILPWLPLVIVFMAVLALFALGVSLLLSIANVYFRDTQHFVAILFQIWFYMTPILYPISLVAERSDKMSPMIGPFTLLDIYRLNPMAAFAEVFRNLMYDNRMPATGAMVACVASAVVASVLGNAVFVRHSKRLAEAL